MGGGRIPFYITLTGIFLYKLSEERETILTLADKDVLAEDDEDVLVNVNMVDDEKYKKVLQYSTQTVYVTHTHRSLSMVK